MNRYNSRFSPQIASYLEFRTSLGFSDSHAKILKRFDAYCSEFQPEASILSKEVIWGWFDYELRISDRNLPARGSAIRSFARYVGGDSYILPQDCTRRKRNFIPYILTDEELSAFFTAVDSFHDKKDPFISMTFSVLLRLLYSCGLRPREGRIIKIPDINFSTGELFIRKSKRNKDRIVVASNEMLSLLKYYLQCRSAWGKPGEDSLFIDACSNPLTARRITEHVKKCWTAANPDVPPDTLPALRPYDLRHRFASALIQKWIDEGRELYAMLPYMRTYMGHARFEDTAYYIHLIPERLINSPGIDWNTIDQIGIEEALWND